VKHPGSRHDPGDPYRVLDVDLGASQQDIARAYRRAAQRVHPDTRPTDPQAAARFQALADAYDLLSDPRRRADYDQARSSGELVSQPVKSRDTGTSSRPATSAYLLSPPPGPPVWAGPVHVEPPAAASQQGQASDPPTASFEDPPVILDERSGLRRSWPW
jgi:curved DNA-binding protein CbpA